MRINIPRLVQDRLYLFQSLGPATDSEVLLASPFANTIIDDDGPFLDGPVSPRLAVVDIDADTGGLRPGSEFRPRTGRYDGAYVLDDDLTDPDVDPLKLEDSAFVQQSVFATAYATLQFFEDLLGRRISWAFPGKQLLIVPRAGTMENAFYERESCSLQFFEAPIAHGAGDDPSRRVFTALSHDIVAHETAHAVLDGIAPDLYDAVLPESLALHESVADLAAIFMTLSNEMVVWSVINISSSTLDELEVLARVAEEFGHDLRRGENASFLRSADNRYVLAKSAVQPHGAAVDRHSPHDCGQVLTGAVFTVFRRHVQSLSGSTEKQIMRASRDICALLFPALDLLPPGECGFADLARAVSTLARISGRGGKIARWLCEELRARGVDVRIGENLVPAGLEPLSGADEATLRRYVQDHRTLLGLPGNVSPTIRVVQRDRRLGSKRFSGQETVVYVGWSRAEQHDVGGGFSGEWYVRTGVTLVFESSDGTPLALVAPSDSGETRLQRAGQLRMWMLDGLLVRNSEPEAGGAVSVMQSKGVFSAASTARTLHIVG
jgi:hypothetical protein